jgi:glycosyl transferase family WbsX
MKRLASAAVWLALCLHARAQTVVREWTPADVARWGPALVRIVRVESGVLLLQTDAGDSHLASPPFNGFPATPWQRVEITMKSDISGLGEIFWTGAVQTRFGGFESEKRSGFEVVAGDFRTYRVEPFWQGEKRIVRLRLDFPEEKAGRYAIGGIRVVEDVPRAVTSFPVRDVTPDSDGIWRARVELPAERITFVTVRMSASAGDAGLLSFASSMENGLKSISFPLRADGRLHTYNIEVGANAAWTGEIVALRLQPSLAKNARVRVESIAVGRSEQGPAELQVMWLGLREALARAGRPARLEAMVRNDGAEPARGVKPRISLSGARLVKEEAAPGEIDFGAPETFAWTVQADQPGPAQASLSIEGSPPVSAPLVFREALELPKAAYVPQPRPAQTDYQVGAYYYPGWKTTEAWEQMKPYPERQPLLGRYREGDPEVADWQIKWAVEHGVSVFLYDWYWDRGQRRHDHAIHSGLFHARYGNMIKFCLLFANHNPPGSHSARDFDALAQYWIDNYFKRPNYLRIDGKPVVVIYAPMNIERDLGISEVWRSFEGMRELCRLAGLRGLYLVACSPPITSSLGKLKLEGYDAVTAYNWTGLNMTAAEELANRSPYASCIAGYGKMWREFAAANALKLIPPVCGGWDPGPWRGAGALVRTGRTPALFKQHLEDCKRFLDTQEQNPRLKMVFIEAWNEWGEGSYIEPQREFGFGYLEAIREVFAPNSPKPPEIVPADVGLGPYDLPDLSELTAWDFTKAGDTLGWTGTVANLRIESGALRFTVRGADPALVGPRISAHASTFPFVIFRLKASRDLDGQLFWMKPGARPNEAASVHFPIRGDSEFHDIKVRAADSEHWRGIITGLRFDPRNGDGAEVAVESIRLSRE